MNCYFSMLCVPTYYIKPKLNEMFYFQFSNIVLFFIFMSASQSFFGCKSNKITSISINIDILILIISLFRYNIDKILANLNNIGYQKNIIANP